MNEENTSANPKEVNKADELALKAHSPSSSRVRRESRYNRIQARKAAQKRADNRFYAGMFSIMGILAMFAILLAALSINGANVDVSGMQSWAQPWLGPLTKLEAAGLGFVGVIAAMAYLRMRKK